MNNPYFNLIRHLWRNGRSWHRSIVAYYLAYIVAQACLSISPYAFGRTIDLLQDFQPEQFFKAILWLVVVVTLVPLFWLFHGPARVVERTVALKIQQTFQLHLYEKITHLPLKWHQDNHSGNIITRVNRATTALYNFAESQFIYIETIVKFIISIAFLTWISPLIGFLSFLTCLFAALTVIFFDRRLILLYASKNEIDNHVGSVFFDYISNMTTILTLRLGELTRSNIFQHLMSGWPFFKREVILNEIKWFVMGMMLSAMQSLTLIGYIAYHLKTTRSILIGTVVMIFRYQWDLSFVFYNLSTYYSKLVRMDADVRGLQPVENDIAQLVDGTTVEDIIIREWQTIHVNSLDFHYADCAVRGQLEQLNIHLKRKEKIALIGASGSGKSTLLNLLSGLYTAKKVQLKIDGVTFDSLKPLRAITTLIPQEPEIFENTIAFNITLDLQAAASDLETVIKLAGFSKVLALLPAGLATDIREKGFNLSVGQKQRLALARGLFTARYSSLILMDEPTSSVDLATEKKILSGIIENEKFSSTTMIVSLHRLHLLPKFDRVIMLEQGKLVADGPVEIILTNPGPVRSLWQKYQ
jgi:ABC-type multidrug transport system fused ATPase/permease subunit